MAKTEDTSVLRTMQLRRPMEENEWLEKAASVSRLDTEILLLEEEKSTFDKDISARIRGYKEERNPLALDVHLGHLVPVKCAVVLDKPEHGMKIVTPLDTGETLEPMAMVALDYQDELPLIERSVRVCEARSEEEPCEPIDPKSDAIQNCRHCGKIMDDLMDQANEEPLRTNVPAEEPTTG